AYQKELNRRKLEYEQFTAEKHAALLSEFRSRVGDYLLKLTEPKNPGQQETIFVYAPGEIRWQIVDQWRDYLRRSGEKLRSVFGPWQALAGLSGEAFTAKVQALASEWSGSGSTNRLLAKALAAK